MSTCDILTCVLGMITSVAVGSCSNSGAETVGDLQYITLCTITATYKIHNITHGQHPFFGDDDDEELVVFFFTREVFS